MIQMSEYSMGYVAM